MKQLKSILDPFVLMLLGTVLLASILPVRGVWAQRWDVLADVAIMLLFFLHGARLPREAIADGFRKWQLHLSVLAATFVLFPILGLALGRTGAIEGPMAAGIVFLALLPSTVQSSIAFTAMARGDVAAAVCSAAFSNLAGIFLTPILVAIFMQAEGGGISLKAAQTIFFQLLLPFAVGHFLRPQIGAFVAKHKQMTTVVDRGSILMVVYGAFSGAVVEHIWTKVSAGDLIVLLVACAVILAVVLGATWQFGKFMKFPKQDRVVLLFCGSKKSLASGVPMAGVLFSPATVGIVILPLMVFHQLQLIACAFIARRLGAEADAAEKAAAAGAA